MGKCCPLICVQLEVESQTPLLSPSFIPKPSFTLKETSDMVTMQSLSGAHFRSHDTVMHFEKSLHLLQLSTVYCYSDPLLWMLSCTKTCIKCFVACLYVNLFTMCQVLTVGNINITLAWKATSCSLVDRKKVSEERATSNFIRSSASKPFT